MPRKQNFPVPYNNSRRGFFPICICAEYIGGEARSDHDENSEVLWLEVEKALEAEDVADLSKKMIQAAQSGAALLPTEYKAGEKHAPQSLYGAV
mgnify:CR=1 FL=1